MSNIILPSFKVTTLRRATSSFFFLIGYAPSGFWIIFFLGKWNAFLTNQTESVKVTNSQWNLPIHLIDPAVDIRQLQRPQLSRRMREPRPLRLRNLSRLTFRKLLNGANSITGVARAPPLPIGVAAINADARDFGLPFLLIPDYVLNA